MFRDDLLVSILNNYITIYCCGHVCTRLVLWQFYGTLVIL